jgi:1,4-dihydroxy-6-naphthoate synthase
MKIRVGISPCPNDTFIFDHLLHDPELTKKFEIDYSLEDVQTLNQAAIDEKYDVVKISVGAYPLIHHGYQLLHAGGAMGEGVGPLLVQRAEDELLNIENVEVAIPGENTTAHALLNAACPKVGKKVFMPYDKIESFVLSGSGLGVIIHENRFTYAERGMRLRMDLGKCWEDQTGSPVPLGAIAIKRSLSHEIQTQIQSEIVTSINKSWQRYPKLSEFIRENAQEMNEVVMRKHIELYVTQYSNDWGDSGRRAIRAFLCQMDPSKNWMSESIFIGS